MWYKMKTLSGHLAQTDARMSQRGRPGPAGSRGEGSHPSTTFRTQLDSHWRIPTEVRFQKGKEQGLEDGRFRATRHRRVYDDPLRRNMTSGRPSSPSFSVTLR